MSIFEQLLSFFQNPFVQVTLVVIGLVLLQITIKKTITGIVRKAVKGHKYHSKRDERQREDTLISIFKTASAVGLWIAGIVIALTILQINVTALMTGAGLIGVIVGFGAQSTIKDFLSGVFVILENQYRVGDVVKINDISGVVDSITIRLTKLRDLDGTVHFIPNGEITTVSNMTYDFANINLDIDVAYDTNLKKLEKVMNEVGIKLSEDKNWSHKILEPVKFLRVNSFGDSAITIKTKGKVQPAEQWSVAGEYRKRLKEAFEENGIEIPFPQRVIHQVKD